MIIGIIGKLQSGKTTLANIIKNSYPNVTLLAFGDLLKEMIYGAKICSKEELWDKKTIFSRMMLQKIGTEIIRKQVDNNFWVNKMSNQLITTTKEELIIIHDVRFQNEVDLIKSLNGKLIRITRPEFKEKNTIKLMYKKLINFIKIRLLKLIIPNLKEDKKHLSETEQDTIIADYEIINDGTLFDLKIKIQEIFFNIFKVKVIYEL